MPPNVEPVPFLDLSAEYRALESEWFEAIRASGSRGTFILGPQVAQFEKELAAYVGVRHAIGVANGTDSLILSLRALGIGPGDEVITTPFTFFASSEAIDVVGATPVFADVETGSFCLDPVSVRARITPRTKAILPVHIFGHPADMREILDIAQDHNLRVIEDCAQAFGAQADGRVVGSLGDVGSFSFYPTKVLGCYGDGGMITTDSDELNERIRRLRNHGALRPFVHAEIGMNSRLDEIQAALLRIKLRRVDGDIAARRGIAAEYDQRLSGLSLVAPSLPERGAHAFNLYTVRIRDQRDRVRAALSEAHIGASQCYPEGLHLQPVYGHLGYRPGDLPVCEEACKQTLSLPIYPGMPHEHIERVAEVMRITLG
jgi:dTDP-4-amino-4,6-dideoxygalactose transaminase